MTRFGVGPRILVSALAYGAPAYWATFRWPDLLTMKLLPELVTQIVGVTLIPPYSSRGPWCGLGCVSLGHGGPLWTVDTYATPVGVTAQHHAGWFSGQLGTVEGVSGDFSA